MSDAARRAVVEMLEGRRLLSVSYHINFQPDGVSVPDGFRVDTGATYGTRANGLVYGWDQDNRSWARDRNTLPDQAYDTLNHMQKNGNRRWEVAVPNGQYQVRVVAGDPDFFDGRFVTQVEGVTAIDGSPTSANRFLEGTVTVNVTDGRLTIANGSGATNNKISFVQINSVEAPASAGTWRVNFQPAGTPVPSGFVADTGATFGGRGGGLSFGWDQNNAAWTRDRNTLADQSFDTLTHTQKNGNRTWEFAVEPGQYRVRVVAGDPDFFDGRFVTQVEGLTVVNASPTSGNRFVEGTATVNVTDGRLTLTNGSGAINNKLSFVEITRVGDAPTPPTEPQQPTLPAGVFRVNFQPAGTPTVTGYLFDTGATFGARGNGYSFGWDAANSDWARDRNTLSDQRFDTLNHMQKNGNRRWEIAVPEGQYRVRVVAGDPDFFDGRFVIQAEGTTAVNGSPSSGNRFVEGTVTVNVTDGRLTITNGSGATNNKISFIEAERIGDVVQPPQVVEWKSGPQLPGAIGEVAGGFIDNKLVVLGDGDSRTFAWSFSTNSWQTLATRAFRAKDQLSEVVNNRLYVFGGVTYTSSGQQASNRTQIYNPTTNTWSNGANIPHGVFAAQTAVINGFIYLAGGVVQGNVTTNKLFRYNPSSNTWAELAPMPIGRNSAPAGTDGSRLFIFGGRDGGDSPHPGLTNVQVYDPATNTWSTSFAPVPRAVGGVVKAPFHNGEFYIIGGETTTQVINRVDIYNPSTNTWRRGPDMPTARHGIYPILAGGRIYVAGGGVVVGKSESRVFEYLIL